jgi:hypothetical protein
MLKAFGCDDEDASLAETMQELREAFDAENALFQAK